MTPVVWCGGLQDVQRKESDLEHNRQANSALEREVQRFKERDDVLKKVRTGLCAI